MMFGMFWKTIGCMVWNVLEDYWMEDHVGDYWIDTPTVEVMAVFQHPLWKKWNLDSASNGEEEWRHGSTAVEKTTDSQKN